MLACERGINLKEIELKDNVVDRPTVLDEQLLDGGAEQLHGLAHVGSGGVEVLVDLYRKRLKQLCFYIKS